MTNAQQKLLQAISDKPIPPRMKALLADVIWEASRMSHVDRIRDDVYHFCVSLWEQGTSSNG